jgi:hypothetical protein
MKKNINYFNNSNNIYRRRIARWKTSKIHPYTPNPGAEGRVERSHRGPGHFSAHATSSGSKPCVDACVGACVCVICSYESVPHSKPFALAISGEPSCTTLFVELSSASFCLLLPSVCVCVCVRVYVCNTISHTCTHTHTHTCVKIDWQPELTDWPNRPTAYLISFDFIKPMIPCVEPHNHASSRIRSFWRPRRPSMRKMISRSVISLDGQECMYVWAWRNVLLCGELSNDLIQRQSVFLLVTTMTMTIISQYWQQNIHPQNPSLTTTAANTLVVFIVVFIN